MTMRENMCLRTSFLKRRHITPSQRVILTKEAVVKWVYGTKMLTVYNNDEINQVLSNCQN